MPTGDCCSIAATKVPGGPERAPGEETKANAATRGETGEIVILLLTVAAVGPVRLQRELAVRSPRQHCGLFWAALRLLCADQNWVKVATLGCGPRRGLG